jgi:hypothetical protein
MRFESQAVDISGFETERQRLLRENAELRACLCQRFDAPVVKGIDYYDPQTFFMFRHNTLQLLRTLDRALGQYDGMHKSMLKIPREHKINILSPAATSEMSSLAYAVYEVTHQLRDHVELFRQCTQCCEETATVATHGVRGGTRPASAQAPRAT